jgi:hypothetical protein
MASARPDLEVDQSGAAANATAVLTLNTLSDPVASEQFQVLHDDLLVRWC